MMQRKHAPNMKKIEAVLKPLRLGYDLETVTAVMERLVAAAGTPIDGVKVTIVTRDTLAKRRIKLMSSRFTDVKDGARTLKAGIVHWDDPGDPVELLTGIPSRPERFPRTGPKRRRPRSSGNIALTPRHSRGRPLSADCYTALLVAVAYEGLTGKSLIRNRKRFYKCGEVIFHQLFRRTAPRSAFHEACKRWERSRGFSKKDMQQQLLDDLNNRYCEHVLDYRGYLLRQYCEHVLDYGAYLMQQYSEPTRAEGRRRYAYLRYREDGGTLRYTDWITKNSPPPSSGASN
jgi:hypothetical protein